MERQEPEQKAAMQEQQDPGPMAVNMRTDRLVQQAMPTETTAVL